VASSDKKRSSIRKVAFHCFRNAGYHDTTIDAICQQAGISKGSFYWYYSSKQEIFIDILDAWIREVVDELYRQFQDALQQKDYVTAITEAISRETRRGRSIVPLWLEFTVHSMREPEIQVALAQFYRRIRYAITEMLRPVLGSQLTDAELEAVSSTIFGGYSGLMLQDICDPSQAVASDTVERFMSALRVWLKYQAATGAPPGTVVSLQAHLDGRLTTAPPTSDDSADEATADEATADEATADEATADALSPDSSKTPRSKSPRGRRA